jgi:dTDP-4-dehydrorhamnose 3,5-epimerase
VSAPAAPESFAGGPGQALARALAAGEPVFLPQVPFRDARGWSLMNQLQGVLDPAGQVNYSLMRPGVVKAWHRHERQTDFWLPVLGRVRAGVHRESDGRKWLLDFGEDRPGVLVIPPGLWHGVAVLGGGPAGLLYYVTRSYEASSPDEQRMPEDAVAGFAWRPAGT